MDNTPYLVTNALGCLSYNKWGRPNPPYIIFNYDGATWQRILVQELPVKFTTPNLNVNSADTLAAKAGSNLISATTIKSLNSALIHKEYKTILRGPAEDNSQLRGCPDYNSDRYRSFEAPTSTNVNKDK